MSQIYIYTNLCIYILIYTTTILGIAVEGAKPFCAIYSTFMQRAIDQLIHDVALQQLPVRFILGT